MFRTKYHRDYSVTLWNVYRQQWVRYRGSLPDSVSASLSYVERQKVSKHLAKGL